MITALERSCDEITLVQAGRRIRAGERVGPKNARCAHMNAKCKQSVSNTEVARLTPMRRQCPRESMAVRTLAVGYRALRFISLGFAAAVVLVSPARASPRAARPDPRPVLYAGFVDDHDVELDFRSVEGVCDSAASCELRASILVPAGAVSLTLPMRVTDAFLVGAEIQGDRVVFAEPLETPTVVVVHGVGGGRDSARTLDEPADFRHFLLREPGVFHTLRLGHVDQLEIHGIEELEGVSRGRVDVRERQPTQLARSGGPLLFVGAGLRVHQGESASGFAGHLGWEFAPTPWLFVGAFASLEAQRVGGFLMLEAQIPINLPLAWGVGVGAGVDGGAELGTRALARVKMTLQFPALAFVMHGAVSGSERRISGGVQLTL